MNLLEDLYWAATVAGSPVQPLDPNPVVYRRTTPSIGPRATADPFVASPPLQGWPTPPCSRTSSGAAIHVWPSCRCARGTVTR